MIDVFSKLIEAVRANPQNLDRPAEKLIYFLFDLKYLTKPDALLHVLNETDFIESILSYLPKLYFIDKVDQRNI